MFVFSSTAIFPPLQIWLSFFAFFFPYKLIFQVLILFEGNFNCLVWLIILLYSSFKMVTSLHWLNSTILWKKHVIISLNTEWSRDFIIVFMFLRGFFKIFFFIESFPKLSKWEVVTFLVLSWWICLLENYYWVLNLNNLLCKPKRTI